MATVDLHSLPAGSRPTHALRNNGPDHLVLERYKLRELAEGWPLYRDACEWENLASIFAPDAHIYTTWSGKVHYASFIASSQAGMDAGAFIMHRCHGIGTDITPDGTRAVTKMKATITQRFTLASATTTTAATTSTCEVDAESDCRFCFFWAKQPSSTTTTGNETKQNEEEEEEEWKAVFVRHWYEKDKLIPVDPRKIPLLSDEDEQLLMTFPSGYRWLAYCQEKTMGVKVALDMPGHRREKGMVGGSKAAGEKHDLLYWQAKRWLDGEEVEF